MRKKGYWENGPESGSSGGGGNINRVPCITVGEDGDVELGKKESKKYSG